MIIATVLGLIFAVPINIYESTNKKRDIIIIIFVFAFIFSLLHLITPHKYKINKKDFHLLRYKVNRLHNLSNVKEGIKQKIKGNEWYILLFSLVLIFIFVFGQISYQMMSNTAEEETPIENRIIAMPVFLLVIYGIFLLLPRKY